MVAEFYIHPAFKRAIEAKEYMTDEYGRSGFFALDDV